MHKVLLPLSSLAGALLLGACSQNPQEQLVEDFGIAYIKRPLVTVVDDDTGLERPVDPDLREQLVIPDDPAGADIWYRDRASPTAAAHNITDCLTQGQGDVRDLETSYDGSKLLFSARLPDPDPSDTEEPTWDIYEYDTASGGCPRRVIGSDIKAGEGDDLAPAYLPDGRIVFSSTRQKTSGAVLNEEGKERFPALDEDRNEPALLLHVMSANGEDIQQISFNQSHDLDPTVLSSGEILFTRWDHAGARNAMNLYRIRPDGTGLKAVFGVHDHAVGSDGATVQFTQPRELEDGRLLSMLKPYTGSLGGGAPAFIDIVHYADNTQPTWPNQGVLGGSAITSAVTLDVRSDDRISRAGRFRGVYPLWDGTNRALVSWSQCRLQVADGDGTRNLPCPETIPADAIEAFPLYGIYVFDIDQQTQLPVVVPEEGVVFEEPVVLAPRSAPQILFDQGVGFGFDESLAEEGVGLLHIRSVYDMDGRFDALGASVGGVAVADLATLADPSQTPDTDRPARFLRIVKAVSIPDDDVRDFDNSAFGRSRQQGMREIVGYAPIQPDGSVLVKVPANIAFAVSVVDADGRRIGGRHQNWLQLRAGETRACNGCHDHSPADGSAPLPHGYVDAPAALNGGAATTGLAFAGTDASLTAEMGETMAQTRIRQLCGASIAQAACIPLSPTMNPAADDWWSNPAAPTLTLSLRYADLATPAPTVPACQTSWKANCRSVVNYETHIHPLWALPRTAADGVTDRTCTGCHNNVDAAGMPHLPDAQLDLGDGPSDQNADHFKAYRELLFPDDQQELVGGILQDVQVFVGNLTDPDTGELVLDSNGNPIPVFDTVRANGPSMSANGSRAGYFMGKFLPGGSHAGDLSGAELRLIAEWLDVGAQYYNNPFDAPAN